MALTKHKLGELIELVDERNVENLGAEFVRGISIDKKFIPTEADMEGVALKNYFLVKPEAFAFVPVTSRNGGKISIAQNDSEEKFICSATYVVFETVKEKLLPEYLMLFFLRSEFDRYARFHSWGSAREVFSWKDLCKVAIPIPDMEIQRVNRGGLRSVSNAEKNLGETQDPNQRHLPDFDKRFAGRGGDDMSNGIFNEAQLERAIIELFERY